MSDDTGPQAFIEDMPWPRQWGERFKVPPGGYAARVTPAECREIACPQCSAGPGEECRKDRMPFFLLGMFVPAFSGQHIHTKRYQARTATVEDQS